MIVAENDWIASKPTFYNTRTNQYSENPLRIFEEKDKEIDIDGLADYLDFGYCVFGNTPFKNIKFIQANQQLIKNEDGTLHVNELPDPAEKLIESSSNPEEVICLLKEDAAIWFSQQTGRGILPLSGGYDSRLLGIICKEYGDFDAYTYAMYENRSESKELNYARLIAEKLKLNWKEIRLDNYLSYNDDWFAIFGFSTHLHGMYHMEFYKKILKQGNYNYLVSGIIGDAWAGGVEISKVETINDLHKLGYTHGMNASSDMLLSKPDFKYRNKYIDKKKDQLKNDKFRIIEAMRLKMMLLRYLVKVPESLGLKVYSPFLDLKIATRMLNLPTGKRKNRNWQKNLFRELNLFPEDDYSFKERLSKKSFKKPVLNHKLKMLSKERLSFIDRNEVENINKWMKRMGKFWDRYFHLRNTRLHPVIKEIIPEDFRINKYNKYLTLRSLDKSIEL